MGIRTLIIIVITILLASIVNSNAENRFCLETDGFVYPIFESPDCEEENHEIITKKEDFYFLIHINWFFY